MPVELIIGLPHRLLLGAASGRDERTAAMKDEQLIAKAKPHAEVRIFQHRHLESLVGRFLIGAMADAAATPAVWIDQVNDLISAARWGGAHEGL